ncbi:MAG TPA: NBR1-Ig-like domain-containing protein, partial [Anaerolineaceae bacterium]|nr:NBR1-Ig-like domain-containing protein [Anaerolineaceae bacterium]
MKSKTISKPRWIFPGLMVLALSLILAACTTPGTPAPTGDPVEQAMQTLQAQATQEYYQTVVAQLTATSPVIENTPTLNPTNINHIPGETTPTAQTTEVPTVVVTQIPATPTQPAPTAVPATPTRIPPTATPIPCYQVTFVQDITIPDGTKIVAGNSFTKTWRIRNSGSCTWDTRFDIAFVDGTQMSSTKVWDLAKEVKPGETVDISIDLTAPST